MNKLEKYCGVIPAFYACYDEAGKVSIEVWDTVTGEIIRREDAKVSFLGTVKIEFDALTRDAAVIVRAVN